MTCPSNKYALSTYKLERLGNQIRYAYQCCSIPAALASVVGDSMYETARTELYPGLYQAHYLDRQVAKCPDERPLMKSMKLGSTNNRLWYELSCIALNPGYSVSSAPAVSATFDMETKLTYAFDQVDVSCKTSTETKYITESKLSLDYAPNPDTAAFYLQCSTVLM